jgi:hypothetical protein
VGKSTILKALAQQNQWQRLAEPEEIPMPFRFKPTSTKLFSRNVTRVGVV